MGKTTLEKSRNSRKLYNYILHFKCGFICQHKKKTILKITFQKLDSRLNIFAVYWT